MGHHRKIQAVRPFIDDGLEKKKKIKKKKHKKQQKPIKKMEDDEKKKEKETEIIPKINKKTKKEVSIKENVEDIDNEWVCSDYDEMQGTQTPNQSKSNLEIELKEEKEKEKELKLKDLKEEKDEIEDVPMIKDRSSVVKNDGYEMEMDEVDSKEHEVSDSNQDDPRLMDRASKTIPSRPMSDNENNQRQQMPQMSLSKKSIKVPRNQRNNTH